MTSPQEQEMLESLKSIAYSLQYLLRYVQVIATQKFQIPSVEPPEQPRSH
jgi:hypothetical protein